MSNGSQEEKFDQLYDAAVVNLRERNISKAVELLLQARNLSQDTEKVDKLLGSSYLVLGDYEKAVACWQNILAVYPRHESARASLELFNRPSNQFWVKRYRQAVAEVEKKNYQVAGEMLRNLLLEQDGHVALYQLLGLCCLAGGDRSEAVKMWEKGLELDRSNPALQEYMELLPEVQKIDLVTENPAVEVNHKKGMPKRMVWAVSGTLLIFLAVPSIIFIQHASKPKYNNPPVIKQSQKSKPVTAPSASKPEFDNSVKDESVQDLSPAGSDYDIEKEEQYYYAARKAYLSRNWKNAVDNYSMVVAMGTGSYLNREGLYYLARTNYLRGDWSQAEKYYKQYLMDFSGTAYCDDSLFFLGCIYSCQNNRERAKEVFQQLKNTAPGSGYLTSSVYLKVME
ncbi:MAG TPA: tetratricopeptide repeat protein [Syntrophomonadaceae bacterium]|nr:tetratricopeptide repeat protein [Syntrophomonadaceae bacterium]